MNFFIAFPPQSGARLHPPHAGAPDIRLQTSIPRRLSRGGTVKTEQTNRKIRFAEYSFHFIETASSLFADFGCRCRMEDACCGELCVIGLLQSGHDGR
jgi:hypothetical protein